MSSRKRHYPESEEEEGRITTDEEDGEIQERSHSKKHKKKSKKHKKDKKHKSKKRRRRSETPDDDRATDREGGSTPEVEAGEVLDISEDSLSSQPKQRSSRTSREHSRGNSRSRSTSRSRSPGPQSKPKLKHDRSPSPVKERIPSKPLKLQRSPSPPEAVRSGSKTVESLSIDESNKLRASLGLPPLKINLPKKEEESATESTENIKDDNKEGSLIPNSTVRHKPAINLTEKSATEKMRERLQQRKMKRMQENKLMTVKTLGDVDEVDNTSKWLKKQKRKEKDKREAEKRAKMLAELDDEFGVGNLVKEDANREKSRAYDSNNLAGLTVQHDSSKFQDGKTVILTLKDSDVLDEEVGDTLVNVNMIDDEKVEKNKEVIKKAKAGYNPYDQEEIDEETGELRRKNMLDQYDEEIDGEKMKSFVIGSQGQFSEEQEKEMQRAKIRAKLMLKKTNVESLETPQLKVASDYYTEEEVVKFKKPKKKKKVKRKMLKADDLLAMDQANADPVKKEPSDNKGALPMDVDDDFKPRIDDEELSKIKVEDDDDLHLQRALKKARRIKQRKNIFEEDRTAKLLEENGLTIKDEPVDGESSTGAEFINTFEDDNLKNQFITINETSEFCRNLGAWRSHEASGLGNKVPKEIREFEDEISKNRPSRKKYDNYDSSDNEDPMEGQSSRYYSRDSDSDDEQKESKNSDIILDEEPNLQSGIAAAIKLASNKGYWETEEKASKDSNLKHLEAKNYTIEDKANDDRHSRRGDRYASGPITNFSEKNEYKPNVNLEYIDDDGRILDQKEAFRYLSHKFHGKGSGKIKTEKRMKKVMEESLMKNMSSTDTPLNTLEKLRQRQKEAATPFVILTGNKVQATDLKK